MSLQVQLHRSNALRGLGLFLVYLTPLTLVVADDVSSTAFFVLCIAGITVALNKKDRHVPLNISADEKLLFLVFTAYVLVALLSFYFGDMTPLGSRKIGRYARFLLFLPLYLLLKRIHPIDGAFWLGTTSGAIVAGFVAMNQVWWKKWLTDYYYRAEGSVNAIPFGDYSLLMALLSISAYGYFRDKGKWYVLLPIAALIFGLIACALSETRGSWAALPLTIFTWVWLVGSRLNRWQRRIALAIFAAIPALWFAASYSPQISKAFLLIPRIKAAAEEFAQLSYSGDYNPKTGIGARIELWKAGWATFKDHPVLGIGVGDFQKSASRLSESGQAHTVVTKHNHVHNEFLMALTERGIVGFLALIGIFAIPLRLFWKAARDPDLYTRRLGLAGSITIVAVMNFGLTEAIFDRTLHITFYVFIVAIFLSSINARRELLHHPGPITSHM